MKHIVIIGNSAAGVNAAKQIRDLNKNIKISILTDEQNYAYYRYKITDLLIHNSNIESVIYHQNDFYKSNNIDLLLSRKVERIVPKKNTVVLFDKTKIVYDALIIASGCSLNMPKDVKGVNKHGVLGVRSIRDIQDIIELIPITSTVCVWGAGIAGIKIACALRQKKMDVKVITPGEKILRNVVESENASLIEKRLEEKGIEIILNKSIVEIFGNGDVKAIKLDTGKVIGCGIVVVDKFLRPSTKFLDNDEINLENGVIVNSFLQTSIENIFAAGDVLSLAGKLEECIDLPNSWQRASEQGKIAGENALKFLNLESAQLNEYVDDLPENYSFDLPYLESIQGEDSNLANEDFIESSNLGQDNV